MSNHRQWVELDPTNGASAVKPEEPPPGAIEDAAPEAPAKDSAAAPDQGPEPFDAPDR